MSIKPLIPPVEALVEAELLRASAKFGERHHSPHEAYAVIKEELEETEEALEYARFYFDGYWEKIKQNKAGGLRELVGRTRDEAIKTACEAIQLAAMCEKALRGYETEDRP